MRLSSRIAAVSAAVATVALAAACGSSAPKPPAAPGPAPTPPTGGALQGMQLFDGWTNPRALTSDINTTGWEDSPFISPDGTTLYFGYTQYDWYDLALASNKSATITGPARPGAQGPAFDVFEATIQGNAWSVVDSTVNSPTPGLSEAAQGVDEFGDRMVLVRFDGPGDLYLAQRSGGGWSAPVKMPANVNTACVEDNPTLSADGKTVWFDSNREDANCANGGGRRYVYETHEIGGGAWSDPVKVVGGPTDAAQLVSDQAFVTLDGSEMYWSGFSSDCPAPGCIFKAASNGDGTWGTPQVVLAPAASATTGDVMALGEVSLTADGHYLYFVYIQFGGGTSYDLNIGVVEKP